jgi:hypothetical protein
MPIYQYEHCGESCDAGTVIEVKQAIGDRPLAKCPHCGQPVRKTVPLINVNTPRGDSSLRDMGFTKLVRRDKGVYENVTRREGDSRYVEADKPHTLPNLKKTISD